MFYGNREIWVLQTMLLLNITGNHLGKRVDHEMSDILQGTMITVLQACMIYLTVARSSE